MRAAIVALGVASTLRFLPMMLLARKAYTSRR